MKKQKCEIDNCTRRAVEKFAGTWLCREHLCPEPDVSYYQLEIEKNAGMKSSATFLEDALVETIDIGNSDEYWNILLEEREEALNEEEAR